MNEFRSQCRRYKITGIVQGVGFRPFVYNTAKRLGLNGFVLNDSGGVTVEAEGASGALSEFENILKNKYPPRAKIFSFQSEGLTLRKYTAFSIRLSDAGEAKTVPISPDIALCPDCEKELLASKNRRYGYPFINCTNCGPRFTIIKNVPYDRPYTTMAKFRLCPECRKEYDDPANRRFHAQPNACPVCGPALVLCRNNLRRIFAKDVIGEACRLLKKGFILAVKGIGGYHLACDAANEKAVAKLRKRKVREDKPFAVMAPDMKTAEKFCKIGPVEKDILTGPERPILLLRKKPDAGFAPSVAPRQKYLGLLLPYTPLHCLIMERYKKPLIMTSANTSDEPIAYKDKDAFERLGTIADYFLTHNREIHMRCDDSVARVADGGIYSLRRSRGYAPQPLRMSRPFSKQILACGAELKNTFCLTKGDFAYISHYIGDLDNPATFRSFEEGICHFKRLFDVKPELIAHDMHPEYFSTKYAVKIKGVPRMAVQHHFAHIAACMADNNILGENAIGIAFDGTGYGLDGAIWGGEFILVKGGRFSRIGQLEYVPLLTGEKAIKEPYRMALSYLFKAYGQDYARHLPPALARIGKDTLKNLWLAWESRLNSPLTSSAGRLFDAVAALTGVRQAVNYEAQAAIEMEMLADEDIMTAYPFVVSEDSVNAGQPYYNISVDETIKAVFHDLRRGTSPEKISGRFHNTVARIIAETAEKAMTAYGVDCAALSGGVFQNMLLLNKTLTLFRRKGIKYYIHRQAPPNDGCISLGQAAYLEYFRSIV
ncbi:MAG: carbamoyltransferase HypF [Planctomycetes bacterium]|nr:carbamoyltransferase HypF [Planctomycetota bacterium]